jgi:hypothetical protein
MRPRLVVAVGPAVLLAAGLLSISMPVATGAAAATTSGASGATATGRTTATDTAKATPRAASFHQTKTITRVNLIDRKNKLVDSRTVSLTVSNTSDLINRQPIKVSWTGAHPTGGIQIGTPQVTVAGEQEYPMVLLECHGTAKTIQPQDCWTSAYSERYFVSTPGDAFPAWRLDRYATAADQRNLIVNWPSKLPAACYYYYLGQPYPQTAYDWLPYVTPTGRSYPIGTAGCAGAPGEMDTSGGLGEMPSNETYAATALDGKGSAEFDVWTSEANPDLGCSDTVACSLVAIPIMGISCDPAMTGMPARDKIPADQMQQATAACEQTGYFQPGSKVNPDSIPNFDLPVSGELWWAASNWRNRFVVPLTFAPPGNICDIVNKGNHVVNAYGSELLDQAMLQWQPHFCLNRKLFTVDYVQDPEPEAAGNLQTTEQQPGKSSAGSVEAALVSDQPPGGFAKPVVHVPVAATGFAISFIIDNAAGQRVSTLRLDARLLAKLLTESYPGNNYIADNDKELLHKCPGVPVPGSTECTNPLNITLDPEFQALNPGLNYGSNGTVDSYAASALLALSSESNVMYALTSYINDNPAARAWLNGKPDPWGMTVNSAYKGIKLPVTEWPLDSTYEPAEWLPGGSEVSTNPCYAQNPSPVLPLIAAPVPDLPDIAEDVQFALAQSQMVCNYNSQTPSLSEMEAEGQQTTGFRFMIAVTSLADARRYDLTTASLETYSKPGTPAAFNAGEAAKDMTFVAPTDASMSAAASLMVADKADYDWTFPYSLYEKDAAKAKAAYPGTMLVYADVPTSDLPTADAKDYAAFLRYVATKGQRPGGGIGELAAGYLPMTAANHLGREAAYALSASSAIAAQKGATPPLISAPAAGSSSSPSGSSSAAAEASSSPSAPSSASPSASPATTPLKGSKNVAQLTPMRSFGLEGYLLPVIAGLAIAAAAAAVVVSRLNRPGSTNRIRSIVSSWKSGTPGGKSW